MSPADLKLPSSAPSPVTSVAWGELFARWTSRVRARSGEEVCIRPLRADDREREIDFVEALSERSRYFRLFTPQKFLSRHLVDQLMDVDYDQRMAFGATIQRITAEEFIGVARYGSTDRADSAEIGITVSDPWQRQGIARLLMGELKRYAQSRGLRCFTGFVLADNQPMLALARTLGFRIHLDALQHLFVITLDFDARAFV